MIKKIKFPATVYAIFKLQFTNIYKVTAPLKVFTMQSLFLREKLIYFIPIYIL